MTKPPGIVQKRLASTSLGVFDANAWIEEGDGLAASACSLRARWLRLKRQIRARKTGPRRDEWSALTGYPRASVLLLGYAIEMYLKAGLAKWLRHCPEYLLDGDTRQYGHDYKRLADDLGIGDSVAPRDLLTFLTRAVTLDARYPASVDGQETAIDAINRRTSNMWDSARFKEFCRLAERLRTHIQLMNGDERNPRSFLTYDIAPDGYIVFGVGGHLPTRITARPPTGQTWDASAVSTLLQTVDNIEIKHFWNQWDLYLDDGKRSRLIPRVP